ncbi:tRNA (adenine(22)-N(1))-methyltransferase [Oceanobacillus polygoni]|uniref:tRNA (Adenine22-N1)-methyltransferase n=2 Tax=Oceanobacillus polygoni TaxID=1235259 RepID=A0A9X0YSJ0_9BACI|nr:class I SAM-dependent methyltransferase [Oceanobacillus polygoni]MBP2078173.1 tRNA (adenine22-N1)-methyltransferase [Oceanobacillus polygoni]
MINTLKLSERLKKVSSFLPEGAYFADIGSDHAYLPCYVCLHDRTAKAIAGEVNEGPFNSAKSTVEAYQLSNRVEVRLGNGLEVLDDITDIRQIVIAGMGGSLIKTILEEGKSKLSNVQRIIAQPNVDERNVRRWLLKEGYIVTNEAIIEENGHRYEIIVADKKGTQNLIDPYTEEQLEKELLFGPILLRNKTAIFYEKWQSEYKKLARVISQMKEASNINSDKMERFEKELSWIREELQDEEQSD